MSIGCRIEEVNMEWKEAKHNVDRERLLFRLMTIERHAERDEYFLASRDHRCAICDMSTPSGSRSWGDVEWPVEIHHYVEFHSHKPSDEQVQAIDLFYRNIMNKRESTMRQGVFRTQLAQQRAK